MDGDDPFQEQFTLDDADHDQAPAGGVDIHAPFTRAERFQQLTDIDQVRLVLLLLLRAVI